MTDGWELAWVRNVETVDPVLSCRALRTGNSLKDGHGRIVPLLQLSHACRWRRGWFRGRSTLGIGPILKGRHFRNQSRYEILLSPRSSFPLFLVDLSSEIFHHLNKLTFFHREYNTTTTRPCMHWQNKEEEETHTKLFPSIEWNVKF